jgi:hypothetical protein
MKKTALAISYLFHPLIMPTLGLFLSGTYIALLDPSAKRAVLFVMALGTLFFPLIMIPILYYRNLISNLQNTAREEKIISQLIILILYIITFVYFMRLPLNRTIHACVLSAPITLLLLIVLGIRVSLSAHMAGFGGITGLIIAMLIRFDTPMLGVLLLTLLAAGLTGSARLALDAQRPAGIFAGYLLGFGVVMATLLLY